jgi:hypothetical protein
MPPGISTTSKLRKPFRTSVYDARTSSAWPPSSLVGLFLSNIVNRPNLALTSLYYRSGTKSTEKWNRFHLLVGTSPRTSFPAPGGLLAGPPDCSRSLLGEGASMFTLPSLAHSGMQAVVLPEPICHAFPAPTDYLAGPERPDALSQCCSKQKLCLVEDALRGAANPGCRRVSTRRRRLRSRASNHGWSRTRLVVS